MNESDAAILVGLIQTRYPTATIIPPNSADPKRSMTLAIKMWAEVLDDCQPEHVMAAWEQWRRSQKWAPDMSELRLIALDWDGKRQERITRLKRSEHREPGEVAELAALESGAPLLPVETYYTDADRAFLSERQARWDTIDRRRLES